LNLINSLELYIRYWNDILCLLINRNHKKDIHTNSQPHRIYFFPIPVIWYLEKLRVFFRFRDSFICQGPRPGDSERTFSVFESSCHLLLPV